jgi:predicted metalloendopeptidase
MKTKKNKIIKNKIIKNKSSKNYNNALQPFEQKYEDTFKGNLKKAHESRENDLKKIFHDLKYGTQPQDDFYTYVDNIWRKNIKVDKEQTYIAEVDDFRLVQDKVYKELEEIINDYTKDEKNKTAHCMKNFYLSAKSLIDVRECQNYAKKELAIIDEYRSNPNNLWKLLGYMNKCEMTAMHCPFYWKVSQDLKNVDKMQSFISSPVFSLQYVEIYFDDGTMVDFKKSARKEFFKYINNVFICCFGKKHGFNPQDVYDIQVQLVNSFVCNNVVDPEDGYMRIHKDEAMKKYNFNWEEFSKCIGYSQTPDFFITSSPSYIKCVTDLLIKNWNSEKWRTYWIFNYIQQLSRFSKIGRHIFADFYAKTVIGVKSLINKEFGSVILTTYAFNTTVTKLYVKEYSIPENIEFTKTLCNDLKIVFTRIIKRSTWLQPKTKETALLKLKHFKFYIGETGDLLPDPLLNYVKDDIWHNLNLLSSHRLDQFIHLNNKKPINIPILVWSTTPLSFYNLEAYSVNASYTPSKNAITVPIAYMQYPFIDLSSVYSFAYNLAHVGFTIGHEMSHSLDDWGSKYDYKGNLNDWWTKEDKSKYKIIQKEIIQQYEDWAKRDGIKYDASLTIGEDLADISGITTIIEYLVDYKTSFNIFPPLIEVVLRTFFIIFAYQMRQYETKRASSYQLLKNVHPPNKYRTNIPLSRTPNFREIYNITKKDNMNWNSTNRVWQS